MDRKTIQRDLDYMRYQLDAPIEYSAKHRGYYYTEPNYQLPAISVKESDLFAIYLAEKLLEAIIDGQIGRLVITHKDRLLRFGAELVFAICEARQVEVVILNQGEDTTFEEDLAKDVLEIITVFSARLYGSRSRKSQKLLDGVRQAVEASQC